MPRGANRSARRSTQLQVDAGRSRDKEEEEELVSWTHLPLMDSPEDHVDACLARRHHCILDRWSPCSHHCMLGSMFSSAMAAEKGDQAAEKGDQDDLNEKFAMAAEKGDQDKVLQHFLEGASPDGRDWNGYTALCNAVREGHREVVKTLLQCRASPDARCSSDNTPLMYAIWLGRHSTVKVLLEGRASLDLKCTSSTELGSVSKTALMYATQYRNARGVDMLLSYRACVNVTSEQEFTALMVAVQDEKCPESIVLALLEAGSSCSHRANGQTAKDLASQTHWEIIEEYEQRLMLLTLHVSEGEPGTSFVFTCTNIGGDELTSGIAGLHEPAASLYATIASELRSNNIQLIFPDGERLDNDAQVVSDVLLQRAQPAEPARLFVQV